VRFLSGSVVGLCFVAATSTAKAEDLWGCEVLLCMANPAGPTAVAPCVPPITRLWSWLAHGHAFPTCPQANAGQNRAYMTSPPLDECPEKYVWTVPDSGENYCGAWAIEVVLDGRVARRIWYGAEPQPYIEELSK